MKKEAFGTIIGLVVLTLLLFGIITNVFRDWKKEWCENSEGIFENNTCTFAYVFPLETSNSKNKPFFEFQNNTTATCTLQYSNIKK